MTDAAPEIAAIVARQLGVTVSSTRPVHGGDTNDALRLDTSAGPLFAKTRAGAPHGAFAEEAAGLAWLGEPGAVSVPRAVLVHDPPDDERDSREPRFLALEWLESGSPERATDEALGRGLAAIHAAGADAFGATPNSGHAPMQIGDLSLSNERVATFAEFYGQRRLMPLATEAHRRGHFSADAVTLIDHLAGRMNDLVGPPEPPARTHGDLWRGNVFVDDAAQPVLIDPVAHGGHREVDLATLELFGGARSRVVDAYGDVAPFAEGRDERVPLFQLATILIHVVLFGGGYGEQAIAIARRYVGAARGG